MSPVQIVVATLKFATWEAALFAAAIPLARAVGVDRFRRAEEQLLAILGLEIVLEATFAGNLSFIKANFEVYYWIFAAVCALFGVWRRGDFFLARLEIFRYPRTLAVLAALTVPLILLSFKPVEEIDSINYLHYLIEWMANRDTPYTFATNFVAFWELSFLPTWMVTKVDLFFPLLALKALMLLGLALWLVGRALGLRRGLLLWAVFGALLLRHLWFEASGVPTLKNDAVHGAGFAILAFVVLNLAGQRACPTLLSLGCAFVCVKYTGIFIAALAILIVLYKRRDWRAAIVAVIVTFFTSGHYYLHNFLRYGSPFYPFQINLGPIHLPGTADLSNTSILYSLRDPRTWQLLFLPAGGISPAGVLFPLTLAAVLIFAFRGRWLGVMLLAGWFLFFRSVFSASASAGDLVFLRSSLNTIRYVDGVLGVSEIFLLSLLLKWPRLAAALVGVNVASRLWILYPNIPAAVFSPRVTFGAAASVLLLFLMAAPLERRRRAAITIAASATLLVVASPVLVERNRVLWTTYWNDLKPALADLRPHGLAHLALENAGYFAGHVVVAGNPVDPRVRSLLPEEIAADSRPPYLAVLPTPGAPPICAEISRKIAEMGYIPLKQGSAGMIYRLK